MLMLHRDITLVTSVNMLKKPRTLQDIVEKGHCPAITAHTVIGMLTTDTRRSAVESPRINILVTVLSSRDLQMIIQRERLPVKANTMIKQRTTACNISAVSIVLVVLYDVKHQTTIQQFTLNKLTGLPDKL